ncbi:alpha/beta hydrolase [Nonomuraea recticatena]|uniref:alpha/beta hydrolase n=1 Tax=Nonomuraea recticatena TaxID=46178 RepID=UPI00360C1E29
MYETTVLRLPSDFEGEVVATLLARTAGSRRAVLYLHGFTDYFFQDHLADFYLERGVDFYALDLRKYGRSLLPHQTRGLIRSVTDYFPEIDEAVRLIRKDHDELTLNAHSTGGLVAALWADRARGKGLVQGLVLNSPFLDLNVPYPLRLAADLLKTPLSYTTRPLPLGVSTAYGQSIHRDHGGEWDFDLELKPLGGFDVHATWLAAIRRAQRRLHGGSPSTCPCWCSRPRRGSGCATSAPRRARPTSCSTPARSPGGPPRSGRTSPACGCATASTTSCCRPNPCASRSSTRSTAGRAPTSRDDHQGMANRP